MGSVISVPTDTMKFHPTVDGSTLMWAELIVYLD